MVNKKENKIVNKGINDKYSDNTFDSIKHLDEHGNEYWYARELSKVLEYSDWCNFLKVLNKAKVDCKNLGFNVNEQLVEVNKLSRLLMIFLKTKDENTVMKEY